MAEKPDFAPVQGKKKVVVTLLIIQRCVLGITSNKPIGMEHHLILPSPAAHDLLQIDITMAHLPSKPDCFSLEEMDVLMHKVKVKMHEHIIKQKYHCSTKVFRGEAGKG